MLYIVVPVVVVAFLLLCCYGGYGNYEYRQKKLLSENQEEHETDGDIESCEESNSGSIASSGKESNRQMAEPCNKEGIGSGPESGDTAKRRSGSRDKHKRGSSKKECTTIGPESNDVTKTRSRSRDKLKCEDSTSSPNIGVATGSSHRRRSDPDDVKKTRSRSRDKLKRENNSSRGDFVTESSHKDAKLMESEADAIPRKSRSRDKLKRESSSSRGGFVTESSHKDAKLMESQPDDVPRKSRSRDKLKRESSSSRGGFVSESSHKDAKLMESQADVVPRKSRSRDKLKRESSSSARREEEKTQDTSTRSRYREFDESVRMAQSILSHTRDVLAGDNDVSVELQSILQGAVADAIQELLKHRERDGVESYMHRKEREKMSNLLEDLQSAKSQMEERIASKSSEETPRIEHGKQSEQRSIVTQEPKTRKEELSKIKKCRLDIADRLKGAECEASMLKEEKKIISSEIHDVKASDETHQTVLDHLVSEKQKLSEEIKKNRKERGEMKAIIDRLKKVYAKTPHQVMGEFSEEEETLESIIAEFSGAKTPAPDSSTRPTMSAGRRNHQLSKSGDNPIDDREPCANPYRNGRAAPNASTRPKRGVRRTKSEREHREKPSRNARSGEEIGRSTGLIDGRKSWNKSTGSLPTFSKDATEDLHASGWLYLNITGQSFRDLAELARNSAPDLPQLGNSESSSRLELIRDKVRQAENNLKAMNLTVRSMRSVVSDDQSLGLDIGF